MDVKCQESYNAGYEAGVRDGFQQGAARCASACNQIAADGLPQPQVDEPEDAKPEERGTR